MEIQVPSLLRIKPNALFKIGKYLRQSGFSKIALYWGKGIKNILGSTIEISLASSEIKILNEEEVETNDIDVAFAAGKRMSDKVQVVVAVGGGTVIDFCKYVAFSRQVSVVSVPTLISNDAFASPVSSLLVNNKRQSLKTIVPECVIIDTEVIRKAPKQFLYSGIGDIICKTTSVFDWKLAFKNRGTIVNDFAAVVSTNAADTFTYYKNKNIESVEYIGIIASSLLMSGIAMVIAGNSRPASGSEHLISHAYDRVAKKPSLHGLQVGVASYAVSYLQVATFERVKRDIMESGLYEYMKQNPLDKCDFEKAISTAPEIKEDYFTILSEKDNLSKLIDFVDSDPLMKDMLA
jgi:glycerol-1-phosphate dehydrogenase [NAD(P)+]